MTNDEVPNDEWRKNDEARMMKPRVLGCAKQIRPIRHRRDNFVIRASSFLRSATADLRHWVFRHSSFMQVPARAADIHSIVTDITTPFFGFRQDVVAIFDCDIQTPETSAPTALCFDETNGGVVEPYG